MSVIWSGVTEGGAIVPVQVTDAGKVVADVSVQSYWDQIDNQVRPVDPSNDIATYANLVLGRPSVGISTIQRLPVSGDLTLTLPIESGTIALTSQIPTPGGDMPPFAWGNVTDEGQVINSFGVSSVTYNGPGDTRINFSTPLSSTYCIAHVGLKPGNYSDSFASFAFVRNTGMNFIDVLFLNIRGQTPGIPIEWDFMVWNIPPTLKTVDMEVTNWDAAIEDMAAYEKKQSAEVDILD